MVQNIAGKYIASLSTMANTANMIIVPDKPNDVLGRRHDGARARQAGRGEGVRRVHPFSPCPPLPPRGLRDRTLYVYAVRAAVRA